MLLPLAFGMAVVVVPQVYVERISVGMPDRMSPRDFHGSYLDFYPHYFEGAYPSGNLSWHHLWFLAYLVVFSLAALPLFLYLRGDRGRHLPTRMASWLRPGRRIFLLALPLAVTVALCEAVGMTVVTRRLFGMKTGDEGRAAG